jgi:hypothetical protein
MGGREERIRICRTSEDGPAKGKDITAETRRTQRKEGGRLVSNFGRRETVVSKQKTRIERRKPTGGFAS